ncbi:MAG: nucleotide exchange factor GrpE [Deltaproteobacteria bacterium]|nr:nucleotide exchange factor GrpE [Deltaproteobacteria bacterium]MBW2624931.1 nucleotide exchange factor GrpE [Deltaproteobacteria bacterium]MBW2721323.1 nucleotide exchange factor GrpE [Deltaproteobacteria bacterium]RLA92156.1 MAG: nucleotide exchange factor GrpE [Deltaproteobacteria bacterium]
MNENQEDQQEISPELENQARADEAEIEQEEAFDPETADGDTLLAKYRELEDKLSEAQERVLRTAADAENFKKRLQREKEEQTRYANESLMRELLPVIDNLERALEHSEAGADQGGLLEGLNMTLKGLLDTLTRFGCTPVEAAGKPFDPNFHEAVSQEESTDHEPNTVLRELQKGYMLKERLLRPAMVLVSKRTSQQDTATREQTTAKAAEANSGEVKIKVKKG